VLLNDLEAIFHGHNVKVLFNAPYFSWGAFPIEGAWGRCKAYWRFTGNIGGKVGDLVGAIRDGLYTDKVAAPGVYNFSGGLFVPDAVTGRCATAEALFRHMFYGAEKSIPVQLAADPMLATDEHGQPSTFDTFEVTQDYEDAVLACRSRVESLRLVESELAELGVEGAEGALEERAEGEESESEEED
jgi:hypothetical protein